MTRSPVNISNLIKNIRNLGYNLENAVGDLIDNSIDANCNNVWININITDPSYFEIIDDGTGMNTDELVMAMQISGTLGLHRNVDSLGKFGMGLKTASFAFTKRFEVYTIKNNIESALYWDIEENDIFKEIKFKKFNNLNKGTKIIWNKIDRFADNLNDTYIYTRLSNYISKTFGELIKVKKINIHLNDVLIRPFDPFYEANPKTTSLPKNIEYIENSKIIITPYILSNELGKENKDLDLFNQQGIYIYRNGRLIGNFGWFNYKRISEQSKLARIKYEIDSSIDNFIHISIDKSKFSSLENLLTPSLKKAIEMVINKSIDNYRRKGTKRIAQATTKKIENLWRVKKTNSGKYIAKINRDNRLINRLMNPEVEKLLTLVESTIPIELFQTYGSSSTTDKSNLLNIIIEFGLNRYLYLKNAGRTREEIIDELINNEAIQLKPESIELILEESKKYE